VAAILGDDVALVVEAVEEEEEQQVEAGSESFARWRERVLIMLGGAREREEHVRETFQAKGVEVADDEEVSVAQIAEHFSTPHLTVLTEWIDRAMSTFRVAALPEYRRRLLRVPRTFANRADNQIIANHGDPDFKAIAQLPLPIFNPIAITTTPALIPEQEPFRGPSGHFTWPAEDIWMNGGRGKWVDIVNRTKAEQAGYYASPGKISRRVLRSIQTVEEQQYIHPSMWAPRVSEFFWCPVTKQTWCRAAKIGDQRVALVAVDQLERRLPVGFGDRAVLHYLEFGFPGNSDEARGFAIMNVLQSATPCMAELDTTVRKEVGNNTLLATFGYYPRTYPCIMSATGAASKKWKKSTPRITWAADSSSIPEVDSFGRPWAINAATPCEVPEMRWHNTRQYCKAGQIIYAAHKVVCAERPELSEILRPESASFDYKSFYRQLFMKRGVLTQQAFFLATPDGMARHLCSPSMLFGGALYPLQSMRVASVLVSAVSHAIEIFERLLRQQAANGDAIALLHAPAELQELQNQRLNATEPLGDHLSVKIVAQFIDDKLILLLGPLRLVFAMCAVFEITDEARLVRSDEKTRCGQVSNELGLQFKWAEAKARQPEDKWIICLEWCRRLQTLKSISRRELESALGTLQFGVAGLALGNLHLARAFKFLYVASAWKGKHKRAKMHDWLVKDIQNHERAISEAAKEDGGKSFFNVSQIPRSLVGLTLSLTDACRKLKGFSGGGGIIVLPSLRALLFHFAFSAEEVEFLPIHILEFCTMLIAVILVSVIYPEAKMQEFQDNQAVCYCCQLLRSADPRFHEGLMVRERVLERGSIESRMEYIRSEDNDVADPASRNDLQAARRNAAAHGWSIERELTMQDLLIIIPDFALLMARMVKLTKLMTRSDKSVDISF
jgi:hypothetical protein